MAKTSLKTTPTKTIKRRAKSKSTSSKKLIPTRRVGIAFLILVIIFWAIFIAMYGIDNLSLGNIGTYFILLLPMPLVFCSLFLLTRPERPALFVSVMGVVMIALYSILPISFITSITEAISDQRFDFPVELGTYLVGLLAIVPALLGGALCVFALKKRPTQRSTKITSIVGIIATSITILSVAIFLAITAIRSASVQNDFEALQRTVVNIVLPDDTQQELACEPSSTCALTWKDDTYRIEVHREDFYSVLDSRDQLHKPGSAVEVKVLPLEDNPENTQKWPLYSYYAVFAGDRSIIYNTCTSSHAYHISLNSGIAFPGEDISIYDDSPDCTTPFTTSIEDGKILIRPKQTKA